MRLLIMIIAPLSAYLCFSGRDIIIFLWTDKWEPAVIFFQILVAGAMWNPIGNLSLSLLQVVNRTGLILKLEFPKKASYVVIIAIGVQFGVIGLAVAQFFINLVGNLINLHPTKKILNYSYMQQLFDVVKYMAIAFPLAWVTKMPFQTEIHLLNLGLAFALFVPVYCGALFIIRDAVALKYFGKVTAKFKRKA